MATVYLARDLRHHRKVAVKVLEPELAAALGGERFLAEIKTTANLQHPHVVPLHDSGESDGLLYYVMPFVEGESLRDRLTRERQLPIDDAVRIAREVADALEYAHAQGPRTSCSRAATRWSPTLGLRSRCSRPAARA
jgi:eukaryotic-like serine/threonine-protein kinase